MRSGMSASASNVAIVLPALQPGDQLLEAQLLEPATDGVELGGAELDQAASLAHEVERLAQPGLARVQALDDRLEARGSRLVGLRIGRLLGHVSSSVMVASTAPSPKNRRTSPASRAAAALVI